MYSRRINGDVLEILSDGNVIFSLQETMEDGTMNIKVEGELRNEVAHDFEDEIMAAFSVCENVVIDFGKTTYIASIAMRALLSAQQIIDENENSCLTIKNLSETVRDAFEDSGFIDILNIEE